MIGTLVFAASAAAESGLTTMKVRTNDRPFQEKGAVACAATLFALPDVG